MPFTQKCKEIFGKAAEAVRDAWAPSPQLQPIPIPAQRQQPRLPR